MKNIFFLFFLCSTLTTFSAENPSIENRQSREIAQLKEQLEAQQKMFEAKIETLMAALQRRDTVIAVKDERIKRLESDEPRVAIGKYEPKTPRN